MPSPYSWLLWHEAMYIHALCSASTLLYLRAPSSTELENNLRPGTAMQPAHMLNLPTPAARGRYLAAWHCCSRSREWHPHLAHLANLISYCPSRMAPITRCSYVAAPHLACKQVTALAA